MDFFARKARAITLVAVGVASFWASPLVGAADQSITFDPNQYVAKSATVDGKSIRFRAYEGLVYVKNPVDVQYETLNIYAPVEYFEGKMVNGYSTKTAPIFFPNSVGGYMPGAATKPGEGMDGVNNTLLKALAQGLVVAAPGARGRTLQGANGQFTGKAPAAIVDLKAAVRYLRYNAKLIPGNVERIVSNGTSAGGALSVLLGATGNNADYLPSLQALGAADERDDIWAVSAYCPITNLDHADAAYEWLLGDLKETKDSGPMPIGAGGPPQGTTPPPAGGPGAWGAPQSKSGPLTADQIALSAQLRALFPPYLNSLGLKKADGTPLTLDANGNGTFRDYVKSYLIASAQKALSTGTDLSKDPWVKVTNGVVTDIDWTGYLQHSGRKKAAPAFDAIDNSSGENNEMGTATLANQHFTAFSQARNTANGASMADPALVKLMNPMDYIGSPGTTTSKNWRIRHGTVDSDTANAIPTILATKLSNAGESVDFALPWDRPHSGDYDLDDLFAWIKRTAQ